MKLKSIVSAVAIAGMLVVTTDYIAYGTTGHSLILGKTNVAPKTTEIFSMNGTPLALRGDKGKPPLKLNSEMKVKNLNADLLDGKDWSDYDAPTKFARLSGDGVGIQPSWQFWLPASEGSLKKHTYLVSITIQMENKDSAAWSATPSCELEDPHGRPLLHAPGDLESSTEVYIHVVGVVQSGSDDPVSWDCAAPSTSNSSSGNDYVKSGSVTFTRLGD